MLRHLRIDRPEKFAGLTLGVALLAVALVGLGAPSLVTAQGDAGVPGALGQVLGAGGDAAAGGDQGGDEDKFVKAWKNLGDLAVLGQLLVWLCLAAVLAASIAYHPWSYGKARTLSEVEAPKTYVVYAVVGAVVGQIMAITPMAGLVVFGIGGLMRFRTDIGAAKDTGRVILVTCIGLCCGLSRPDIAIVATVFAFVLVAILERGVAYKLTVKGLTAERVGDAAEAYRLALLGESCAILNEKKNFVKQQVVLVFRAPREYDREDLEAAIEKNVADELRGAMDWQSS